MKNTTLCYIENQGRYLMLHRTFSKGDGNDGKWIGVGGHFEENESPFDCVIREVREETGLTLLKPKYRGIVTFVSDKYQTEQMHLFTCDKSCKKRCQHINCNNGYGNRFFRQLQFI